MFINSASLVQRVETRRALPTGAALLAKEQLTLPVTLGNLLASRITWFIRAATELHVDTESSPLVSNEAFGTALSATH